ncbi:MULTISPECIES: cold-shock protein [Salinimicrobium]|uniref:cold-shock protein n=1 Tax=Salinimicrobium TaxID=561367 RepID=UPI001E31A5A8|nr:MULTISPECIES: cold shock domain-containing protein [Salinimicrobium]MCC8358657.1 cold shock domain-containing protein [Salinimicrobium sediminilitoris]MCY2687055.1 cold shock domain-containing protein [Salinimicrobium sp. TH3]
MAKSQQTYNKIEKEKKRLKKREEKKKKKEERKASGDSVSEFAYVDEFGNLTDTPPDPSQKVEVDAESIEIGIPKKEESDEENDFSKEGKVSFFDHSKGFGFILDSNSQEKYFVHVTGLIDEIEENDKVTFELEKGPRGMNAVRVKKI